MLVKTNNLTGAALDWAVLESLKPELKHPDMAGIATFGPLFGKGYKYPCWGTRKYDPSVNWKEGGPIIEREKIGSRPSTERTTGWVAADEYGRYRQEGPTALIATMRCYVASKMGDEVNVPEELL